MIAEVIATYGRHLLLRDAAGERRMARPMGRHLEIVCGDRVQCRDEGDGLLAESILPRSSFLRRSTLRGRSEPLAANLTQLAVIVAPVPAADFFLIDRYLCAAASAPMHAVIVLNKCELPDALQIGQDLAQYSALGYEVLAVSALATDDSVAGLAPLSNALRDQTTIMVGQSGVGKSSLTRLITSDTSEIAIGGLMREEEGRHTTTASRLYECDAGGRIIDSPGVRDFAPAIDDLERTTLGFREVSALAAQCRFQDCSHMQEPHCAVRAAVEAGTMHARRYESYRRLRRLFDELWSKRPERERAARR
ncbi:MAG: ribosome small subunit-dependent GTPase A [Steroidobacteraceae bacterium]